ncbi:MAG TPA: aldo/keto reductase [Phycisphaerae bacterium]|nr:aldo/keto reductase [Phycisphaerae bacterium]
MTFNRLGRSGLKVSDIGLGTWKFGYPEQGDGARADEKTSLAILDKAAELGVVFWDTADRYNAGTGNSERIIGQWLGDNPNERTNIVLATKCRVIMNGVTPNHEGLSRRHITEAVHHSLQRLRQEHIDLLQFHSPDPDCPPEESVRAVDDLIRQGLVQYWGVSNFDVTQLTEYQRVADHYLCSRLISVQNHCNVLDKERASQTGVLEFCAANGVGFIPYSPLARGLASDRYVEADAAGPGDRLYDEGDLTKVRTGKALHVVQALSAIGENRGKTVAQIALAWLLSMPGVATVIPSCSTPQQLAENAAASGLRLVAEEMQQIEQARSGKPPN